VTTLKKALDLLEALAGHESARPIELAQNTGLTRSNVNRLLATLREMGYVESRDGKSYQLGYKVFVLGNSVPRRNQLTAIAYPYLVPLAELCQENVNLGVLHNQRVLYIDKVESTRYVRVDRSSGGTDPVYCTALGKVLLTGMTDLELATFASVIDYNPRTKATITNANDFIACVNKAARDGYATDMCELSDEIRCIAAPIMVRDGRVVAGISISAPSMRLSPERMTELRSPLLQAAFAVSATMGYSRPLID
jgi:IclR family KDG regulon transcriptional repressor